MTSHNDHEPNPPNEPPPPGSDKAIALGCTCPVLDNAHGAGLMIKGVRNFWFNEGCPLHHPKPDIALV